MFASPQVLVRALTTAIYESDTVFANLQVEAPGQAGALQVRTFCGE
jgi:hypothetical protein